MYLVFDHETSLWLPGLGSQSPREVSSRSTFGPVQIITEKRLGEFDGEESDEYNTTEDEAPRLVSIRQSNIVFESRLADTAGDARRWTRRASGAN